MSKHASSRWPIVLSPSFVGSAQATRLVLALSLCAPLSCAFCGSEQAQPPKAVPHADGHASATAIVPEPLGVPVNQGPCPDGFFLSTDKRCVPLAWHCAPAFYEGGATDGCDCNCGAPDPDCADPSAAKWCYRLGRTQQVSSCQACNEQN